MIIYLPSELLEKILSFIDETDSHTMHSCILANRIWCKTMMPKLWRNPFHLVALRPSEKLIPVYFKFLSNETKLILQVPLSSIKSSSLQLRSLPAIFDYPKFLRELDFNELYLAIRKWCFSNLNTLSSTNQRGRQSIFILQELCSLLMRNCDRLDLLSLDIKSLRSNNSDGGMSDHIALPCLVGASNCLSSLKTFISRGYYEKQLVFKSMTQYCKNIREIIVEDNDSTDGDSLIDLIIIQNHLEKFVIGDWWGNLSKIFQSLKTQFESLIYVEIHGCHFYEYVDDFRTFEGLVFCQNLETLKIEECYNLTSEIMRPLANTIFPKLKTFYFSNYLFQDDELDPPFTELISLIENSGSRLNELCLNMELKVYPNIINICSEWCRNLKHFKARIQTHSEVTQLLTLLSRSKQLESLEIIAEKWSTTSLCNIQCDTFFPDIGNLIPQTLKYFGIDGWMCTPRGLECFLKNCKAKLERMSWMCFVRSDEYLNVVTKWAEKNGRHVKNWKEKREWGLSFILIVEFC
ncbi:hypothetical protein C2G38_2104242 [Gigaspora rosea]|uniref:F-box domain-containing protein n=1 Tax=Gigaspora rosea TaxID=44941 RepID=A0A397UUI7_9GLOM|nr:hypothetical protein C2G38_2104242 [Gigaspora rosea]